MNPHFVLDMENSDWPWQYSFPPFFTLQINEDTKRKQLEAWCDLVLAYCQRKRIFQLDLVQAQSNELFNNRKIDRKCPLDLQVAIVEHLVKQNRAEWLPDGDSSSSSPVSSPHKKRDQQQQQPPKRTKCLVFWLTLDEWAAQISQYVNKRFLQNTVCTFYELLEADEARPEKFYQADTRVFERALKVLQAQGKCEVFFLEAKNPSSGQGVKFF